MHLEVWFTDNASKTSAPQLRSRRQKKKFKPKPNPADISENRGLFLIFVVL